MDHGQTGNLKWLTFADCKVIGLSYIVTSLVMFFMAGIMAIFIRHSPHGGSARQMTLRHTGARD
jgi:heme/copper-type cytochrome/quinol oxidase subunit 1